MALALIKVLQDRLKKARTTTATAVTDTWKVSDRNAAVLPGDTKIGSITLAKGKTTAEVDDEDAFLEWVLVTHPGEVEQKFVVQVKPDFIDRMLAFARQTGSVVDPATGEVIPGLLVREGDPHPMVTLERDAADLVARAWQDGQLGELLGGLFRPELEAGDQ
ncbi:hypothetical protein BJF79_49015 [Actinomadura sp. CNU-125]|uniref:hypothetical protein n=1 Tax=Actinomadura sp. CNU-125 TaxID=1904961 RepID=UPI00095F9C77|nr:hypothetical protein [Actinomadura sp. CNU-125]OLT14487.1 hypothetical protein BJF79_49015 [Actinomadura sp. CNU-125]